MARIWILSETKNLITVNMIIEDSEALNYFRAFTGIKHKIENIYQVKNGIKDIIPKAIDGDVIIIVCSTPGFYEDIDSKLNQVHRVLPIYVFIDFSSEFKEEAVHPQNLWVDSRKWGPKRPPS